MSENIIGKYIDRGKHRKVYEYLPDNNWVVKINKPIIDIREDANSAEFFYYQLLKKHNLHHFLFKCKYDEFGNFIMKKCTKKVKAGKYKIPGFFVDIKRKNWGMNGEQIACLDYSWFLDLKNQYTMRTENGIMYFKKDKTIVKRKEFLTYHVRYNDKDIIENQSLYLNSHNPFN